MNLLLGTAIISIWVYSVTSVNYSDDVYNKKRIISLERPQIIMEHPQIIHVVNITARRPGRSDPHHYIHICVSMFTPFNNSFTIHISVTENKLMLYSFTYLELHYTFCEFLKMFKYDLYYKENITDTLAPSLIKFKNNDCSLVPGTYYFANMILPRVNFPKNFPLQKSRLYVNLTYNHMEMALRSHIDLELKAVSRRRG